MRGLIAIPTLLGLWAASAATGADTVETIEARRLSGKVLSVTSKEDKILLVIKTTIICTMNKNSEIMRYYMTYKNGGKMQAPGQPLGQDPEDDDAGQAEENPVGQAVDTSGISTCSI